MTAKPNILHNPWNYPYSEWGVNEQTYSTAVPSEEAFPYEDFVGNSRMGADLWAKNPALRQVPKNNRYTYIGAIAIEEVNGAVVDVSKNVLSNFKYTGGIYGSPVPGSGDQITSVYMLRIAFDDAKSSVRAVAPLVRQFERCPIIPIKDMELAKDAVTAVAQLQMNIRTAEDLPDGMVVELMLAPINVANYMPAINGESLTSPDFWAYVNYSLLKWYVYDFRNAADLRGVPLGSNDAISDMESMYGDVTLQIGRLDEGFVSDVYSVNAAINQVMDVILSTTDYFEPATDEDGNVVDRLTTVKDELRGKLRDALGIGDSEGEKTKYDDFIDEIAGSDGPLEQLYKALIAKDLDHPTVVEAMRKIVEAIHKAKADISGTMPESLVFNDIGLPNLACSAVNLQLINQFKSLPLENSGTGIWQYLGPGMSQLMIEAIEYNVDENPGPHNTLDRMMNGIADDVRQLAGAAQLPPSIMFCRVFSWPTILAGKFYCMPDAMQSATVQNQPGLRSLAMRFTLFDGDYVRRCNISKMWKFPQSSKYADMGVEGWDEGGAEWLRIGEQIKKGQLSFYDAYSMWFLAEEGLKYVNIYPMDLPTWGELSQVSDDYGPLNHISPETIGNYFKDAVTENKISLQNDRTGKVNMAFAKDISDHTSKQNNSVIDAYAPPDFWCIQNDYDYMKPYIDAYDKANKEAGKIPERETGRGGAGIKMEDTTNLDAPRMANSPWAYDVAAGDFFLDETQYSCKFSLRRAFPAAYFMFTDHKMYAFGARVSDATWGYGALESMVISKPFPPAPPVDIAKIRLVNLFGALDDPVFIGGGLMQMVLSIGERDVLEMIHQNKLRIPLMERNHLNVGQRYQITMNEAWESAWSSIHLGWDEFMSRHRAATTTAAERFMNDLRKAKINSNILPLSDGQWVHVRLGYGQPYMLPTVFNGKITNFISGPVVDITCEGFGVELEKQFPVDVSDHQNVEPRQSMAELLNRPRGSLKWIELYRWISQHGIKDAERNVSIDAGIGTGVGLMGGAIAGGTAGAIAGSAGAGVGAIPGALTGAAIGMILGTGVGAAVGGAKKYPKSPSEKPTLRETAPVEKKSANFSLINERGIELWYPTEGLGMDRYKTKFVLMAEGANVSHAAGWTNSQYTRTGKQSCNLSGLFASPDGGEDIDALNLQSELSMNMYPASCLADAGISQLQYALADEITFGYSKFGKTFNDLGLTSARVTGEYIYTVVPFANRGTIYFGKLDWPIWTTLTGVSRSSSTQSDYVSAEGENRKSAISHGNAIATRRPFDQMSVHTPVDIIQNRISVSSHFANGIRGQWSHGKSGNLVQETNFGIINIIQESIDSCFGEGTTYEKAPIQWFDADIHPAMKRAGAVDTQILRTVKPNIPMKGEVATVCALGGLAVEGLPGVLLALAPDILEYSYQFINTGLDWFTGVDMNELAANMDREMLRSALGRIGNNPAPELVEVTGAYWEQVNATGRGILKEQMQSMYDGALIIIGNPIVRPHCTQMVFDPYTSIQGAFTAGNVVHQFGVDTGFITEIQPRCITTVWRPDWLAAMTLFTNATGMQAAYDIYLKWAQSVKLWSDCKREQTLYAKIIMKKGIEAKENADIPFNKAKKMKWNLSKGGNIQLIGSVAGVLTKTVSGGVTGALVGGFVQELFTASVETIQAARAAYIAPLLKYGLPYTGGITGWRGSVLVDGKLLYPSEADLGHGTVPWVSEVFYKAAGAERYTVEDLLKTLENDE